MTQQHRRGRRGPPRQAGSQASRAEEAGVSKAQIQSIDRIRRYGTKSLIEAMESGDVSVTDAESICRMPWHIIEGGLDLRRKNGKRTVRYWCLEMERILSGGDPDAEAPACDVEGCRAAATFRYLSFNLCNRCCLKAMAAEGYIAPVNY